MIELKPCKKCGSYPNIYAVCGGMEFCVECSLSPTHTCLKAKNRDKDKYNDVLNEILTIWNKQQEEQV